MKIKFLSIFAAAALLASCGGNEEAQTELEGALENLQTELNEVEAEVEEVVEEADTNATAVVETEVEEVPAH